MTELAWLCTQVVHKRKSKSKSKKRYNKYSQAISASAKGEDDLSCRLQQDPHSIDLHRVDARVQCGLPELWVRVVFGPMLQADAHAQGVSSSAGDHQGGISSARLH